MKQLEYSQLKGINQFYVFSHHPTAQQTPLISKIFNATTVGSVLKQGLKFYTGWQFDDIKMIIIKKNIHWQRNTKQGKRFKCDQKLSTTTWFLSSQLKSSETKCICYKKKNRQKSHLK